MVAVRSRGTAMRGSRRVAVSMGAAFALIAVGTVVLALVLDPVGYRETQREFAGVFRQGEAIEVVLSRAAQNPELILLREIDGPAPAATFAISGWTEPKRAATYRVYIWNVRGAMLAYVYVEHDHRVSDVFWSGS
jgi:hypothetical protein